MKQCTVEKNKGFCTCTYSACNKKGVCCECIQYHLKSGEIPGCLFPKEEERTYDRTIGAFIKAWQRKGY